MFLVLVRTADAEIIGATPRAASLRDVRCAPGPGDQWTFSLTVEV
jgi:hypothetical protein